MITLNKISKHYSHNNVLENVSLSTQDNAITGIIGPNGAGKSTLIRIMTGFEFSDSGSVSINQKNIPQFNQIKDQISYMPERMTLYPNYFVDDFLSFYHAMINHKDVNLLKSLSLETIFDKQIKQLSKGWHQRLKLYLALCNKKKIIVLDEPFDGFDPLQLKQLSTIIQSQNRAGREFILSIHQLSYAQKICTYFIFLNQGKLIAEGSFKQLALRYSITSGLLEDIFIKAIAA